MSKDIMIRYSLPYSDNSGERMSIEIDSKEKDFQVKINNGEVLCTLNDLKWLNENINRALNFIEKEKEK